MMDNDDDYPETLLVCLDLLISEACLQNESWLMVSVEGFLN